MPAHHTLSGIISTESAPKFVEQQTSKRMVSDGTYFGKTTTENSYVEGNALVNKFSSTSALGGFSNTSVTQGGANSSSTTHTKKEDRASHTTAPETQVNSSTAASEGGGDTTGNSSKSVTTGVTLSRSETALSNGQTNSGSSSATKNYVSNTVFGNINKRTHYETITGHTTYASGSTKNITSFTETEKRNGDSFSSTSSAIFSQSSFAAQYNAGATFKTEDDDGNVTIDDGGGPTNTPAGNAVSPYNNDDGDKTEGEYTPVVIESTFEDTFTTFTQSDVDSTYYDTTTSESEVAIIPDSDDTSLSITITVSQTVIKEDEVEDTTVTYDTLSVTTSEGTIDTLAETIPLRTKSTFTIYGNAGFATVNTSDSTEIAMTDMVQSFSDEGALRPEAIDLEADGFEFDDRPEFDTKITRITSVAPFDSTEVKASQITETTTISVISFITDPPFTTLTSSEEEYFFNSSQEVEKTFDSSFTTAELSGQGTTYQLASVLSSMEETTFALPFFDGTKVDLAEATTRVTKTIEHDSIITNSVRVVDEDVTYSETSRYSWYPPEKRTIFIPAFRSGAGEVFTGAESVFFNEQAFVYETTDISFDKNFPPLISTFETTTQGDSDNSETTTTNSGMTLLNLGNVRSGIKLMFSDSTLTKGNIQQSGSTGKVADTKFFDIFETGQSNDLVYVDEEIFVEPGEFNEIFEFFAGARDNFTHTGFLANTGAGKLVINGETSTLTDNERFSSTLTSDEIFLIKDIPLMVGETRQQAGAVQSDLNSFSPFNTSEEFP